MRGSRPDGPVDASWRTTGSSTPAFAPVPPARAQRQVGGEVGTEDPVGVDVVPVGPPAVPLVRAAAALRWARPDLTATLAGLALESATDLETWMAAAGWLLHGRTALGDGRDAA